MSLTKIALRIGLPVAVLYLTMQYMVLTAPEPLERYEGVKVAAPAVGNTTPPPLPPGFPSMERPPPKITVPEGQSQPIDTKFGWTYDIPADWKNSSTGFTGWRTGEEWVTYGAIGDYGNGYCAESDGSTLGTAGMTGRNNGLDLATAAFDAARDAEVIYGSTGHPPPILKYLGPVDMRIADEPAVRFTVQASNVYKQHTCDPEESVFDVVTMPGFATAPMAVFMVKLDQGLDGSLDHSVADQIIATLRRSTAAEGSRYGG